MISESLLLAFSGTNLLTFFMCVCVCLFIYCYFNFKDLSNASIILLLYPFLFTLSLNWRNTPHLNYVSIYVIPFVTDSIW